MDPFPHHPEDPYGEPEARAGARRGLRVFGFPLRIDPFFFVTAWLIGGRREPLWMLSWIAIVVLGVLAHELGHAFAGRRLGLQPWIRLVAFGGVTGWSRPRPLTAGQQIAISAAGPAVGITIGGAVLAAGAVVVFSGAPPAAARVLSDVLWVNLGWAVLNLLPILPLDGGHITASAAEMVAGRRGRLAARSLSVLLTIGIGLWAALSAEWWIFVLCAIFAYTNVQGLRAELASA